MKSKNFAPQKHNSYWNYGKKNTKMKNKENLGQKNFMAEKSFSKRIRKNLLRKGCNTETKKKKTSIHKKNVHIHIPKQTYTFHRTMNKENHASEKISKCTLTHNKWNYQNTHQHTQTKPYTLVQSGST